MGVGVYLAVTLALSWLPALFLSRSFHDASAPVPARLCFSSFVYVASMGWQPLLAVWIVHRWIDADTDRGARFQPISTGVLVTSIAVPLGLLAFATVIAYAARTASGVQRAPATPTWLPAPSVDDVFSSIAVWTAAFLVWTQAAAEEVGWRGYFLNRLMRLLGPWQGLVLHGAVWGFWYAPFLLAAGGHWATAALRSIAFVLTCCLLGILLGWLRLAARSLAATTIANSLLTIGAGLPLLLTGDDPGLRGSVYGPAGWLLMATCLVVLLRTRLRHAVRVPDERRLALRVSCPVHAGSRTLH